MKKSNYSNPPTIFYRLFPKMSPLGLHYFRVDASMKTLIDVGAGRGYYFKKLKEFDSEQKFSGIYSIGLDASSEALKIAKKNYSDVVQCDIRKMPIRQRSIDVVICDDVIEHLQKKQGKELLVDIERVSSKLIIVSTQVGFVSHEHGEDTWQIHRSGWMPEELRKRRIQSIWNWRIEENLRTHALKNLKPTIRLHTAYDFNTYATLSRKARPRGTNDMLESSTKQFLILTFRVNRKSAIAGILFQ